MISMRTGSVLIVIFVILLNLYLMGSPGGRGSDYTEYQRQEYEPDIDDAPVVRMTMEEIEAEFEAYMRSVTSPTPAPSATPK